MDAKFNLWYQELVRVSDSPVYLLTRLDNSIELGSADDYWASISNNSYRPFSFPDLEFANSITLYWTLKLVISSTIANIYSATLSTSTAPIPISLKTTVKEMLVLHGEKGGLENAIYIVRSMSYCLHDSIGLLGAQKSLIPLRTALLSLRKSQNEEWTLYTYIYANYFEKGMGLAKHVADMWQKLGINHVSNLLEKKCFNE